MMPESLNEAIRTAAVALAAAPTPAIDRPDMEAVRASIAAEVRDRTALLDARLAGLRKAAQAIVDGWDESLRLWQAAAQENGNDGPAMDAIRDPARETRRVAAEEALRAALALIAAAPKEEPTREDVESLRRQLAAVDRALGCVEGDQFSGWVEDGGRVARITRLMKIDRPQPSDDLGLRAALAACYADWPGGGGRLSQDPISDQWWSDPDGPWVVVYLPRVALDASPAPREETTRGDL
jgi:hypothetical protein